jgi:hypothetical protein
MDLNLVYCQHQIALNEAGATGSLPERDRHNRNNESLGGRPLAVATRSVAGYAAVEAAIRLLSQPIAGRQQ